MEYKQTEMEDDFDLIYNYLSSYYEDIAINIYEWKGLEDISNSLTSEIIERQIYEHGASAFFDDANLGYLSLKAGVTGRNAMEEPNKWLATGLGISKQLNNENSVLIRANIKCKPPKELVDFYCRKLADIELTKQLRRNAHKTPMTFEVTDNTLLTAKNFFKKIRANEPMIFKNKSKVKDADIDVSYIDSGVEYINDKLDDEYNTYVARILTILGIKNYVEDKAERVQSAEVKANDDYIKSSFKVGLEQRQKACERINKMYGLNLSIEYSINDDMNSNDYEGGEEDE